MGIIKTILTQAQKNFSANSMLLISLGLHSLWPNAFTRSMLTFCFLMLLALLFIMCVTFLFIFMDKGRSATEIKVHTTPSIYVIMSLCTCVLCMYKQQPLLGFLYLAALAVSQLQLSYIRNYLVK